MKINLLALLVFCNIPTSFGLLRTVSRVASRIIDGTCSPEGSKYPDELEPCGTKYLECSGKYVERNCNAGFALSNETKTCVRIADNIPECVTYENCDSISSGFTGYYKDNQSCYITFAETMPVEEMEAYCARGSGHLATIPNKEVFERMKAQTSPKLNYGVLSLFQEETASQHDTGWFWKEGDGSKVYIDSSTIAWEQNEPNGGSENCAGYPRNDYIDDRGCGDNKPICEFEAPKDCAGFGLAGNLNVKAEWVLGFSGNGTGLHECGSECLLIQPQCRSFSWHRADGVCLFTLAQPIISPEKFDPSQDHYTYFVKHAD